MSQAQSNTVVSGLFSRSIPVADVLLFRGRAADGAYCLITFDRRTVVVSRPVAGLPCRIRVDPRHYQGVAVIERPDGQVVHLLHHDPGLSIDLVLLGSLEAAEEYRDRIASLLRLEPLTLAGRSASGDTIVSGTASGPRRVRATAPRRPRFLARRRKGEVISIRKFRDDAAAALS